MAAGKRIGSHVPMVEGGSAKEVLAAYCFALRNGFDNFPPVVGGPNVIPEQLFYSRRRYKLSGKVRRQPERPNACASLSAVSTEGIRPFSMDRMLLMVF